MIDIKKAEPSQAEADSSPREPAPIQSEVIGFGAAKIRQSNERVGDLGGIVHGGDVEDATTGHTRQIEQIDDEFRRALEPGLIEYVPVGDLKPDPHNARKHPDSQIELLAASIRQFGFVGAITVTIGGSQRLASSLRILRYKGAIPRMLLVPRCPAVAPRPCCARIKGSALGSNFHSLCRTADRLFER